MEYCESENTAAVLPLAISSFASSKPWCKAFNSAVSAACLAMFHSARAILYLDGFREKSHACVARYVAQYVQKGKLEQEWVDLLDHHREIRHENQYDLGFFATEDDAKKTLESATKFIDRMKQLFALIEK